MVKQTYWVTRKVNARVIIKVEAENVEEALEKSEEEMMNFEFNDLDEIVDDYPIIVEDDKGNFVWKDGHLTGHCNFEEIEGDDE